MTTQMTTHIRIPVPDDRQMKSHMTTQLTIQDNNPMDTLLTTQIKIQIATLDDNQTMTPNNNKTDWVVIWIAIRCSGVVT
jgi:hypothetical protein